MAWAADEGGLSGAAGVVVLAVSLAFLERGRRLVVGGEGGWWLLCRPLCGPFLSLEGFGLDALLLHLVFLCCDELGLFCGFG